MVDNVLFTKKSKSHLIIVQIYVDDIIFGSTSQNLCDDFAKIMHDEFEMSMMGELNFFLGLQIKQMEDGIFFNQSKYVKEMLKKFRLEDSKPTKIPMSTKIKLTKDDEADSVDSSKYRAMIGSLLYLTASMPDIMFSVCLCARFQENSKTTYLEVVKRIFRYIRGTSHLGLWYPKGTIIEAVVHANFDHAGDYVDRKSTSGIYTFMGYCLTSWFAKKQTALAISVTEAEYVSVGKACQQALWMKQSLIDYGIRLDDVLFMCENKCAIDLSPTTADEKIQKKNDVKARSMLLMALPNEHLMTFNKYKHAKSLFDAITTRFGGNDNMAFVSTSSTSNNDDVSTVFGVSTASPQVSTANLSDATVYAFLANQPTGSQLMHEDLEQIHEDDLEEMDLKWQLALLSIRAKRFFQKTGKKITINGSDTAGYDKAKVQCFNYHKMGHFARECRVPRNQENITRIQETTRRTVNVEDTSSKAMMAIDEAGFD
nr:hypothetical protein [Tanacetum cinerariifolium]